MNEYINQSAEGMRLDFDDEQHIKTDRLTTFKYEGHRNQLIEISCPEFSAVCPYSGLPDIAEVYINYYPSTGRCLELKALKYYFLSFRNVGIYQENVTNKIWQDLCNCLGHRNIRVVTKYNTRGGIDTTCIMGTDIKSFSNK